MARGSVIAIAVVVLAGVTAFLVFREPERGGSNVEAARQAMNEQSAAGRPQTDTASQMEPDMTAPSSGDWASTQAAFLTENLKQPGWQALPSGMQYRTIKAVEGDTPKPAPGSPVTVHYEGRLTNGEVFDSSYARNEPATFPLSGVIKGWQDGVPMMKQGETWEFAIPAGLAYGDRDLGVIPPGSTLIFKIELLEVQSPA